MEAFLGTLMGGGLAIAAGLNAYVPLLVLGLAGRLLPGVDLPDAWMWLENEWVLGIIGVLLVIEVVADKIPVVDSINDVIQTVVRPVAGGIAFGTGSGTATAIVQDPAAFFTSTAWIPVVLGVVLALVTHLVKAGIRPVANAATGGVAAPIVSTAEDIGAVIISVLAIAIPVAILLVIAGGIVWLVVARARRRRRRAEAQMLNPPKSEEPASKNPPASP